MANPANGNKLALVLVVIITIALFAFVFSNWHPVSISLGSASMTLPFGLILLLTFAMGKVAVWAFYKSLDKTKVNEGKIAEWQAQDVKLAASVASDREKQLEAKIATLETALKTALKKK